MPTETFKKLEITKQKAILQAAKKEFSKKLLKDASINQIVKDAGISRGSFYMYFQDIEDIYVYLLVSFRDKVFRKEEELLKKYKGDLFQTFLEFYDQILLLCKEDENQELFQNIFLNMNLYIEEKHHFPRQEDFIKDLLPLIDTSLFQEEAKEEIIYLYHLLFRNVMESILLVIHFEENALKQKENLKRQFAILKKGIMKKGVE